MTITLSHPKSLVVTPAVIKEITKLTIVRVVDIPKQKLVRVFVEEINTPIILWSGDSYDAIGQYTDTDVQLRLLELYS